MLSKYTNLYFPICSLAISLLIFILFFCKKKVQNKETKIYAKLLICGLVESMLYTFICLIAHKYFNDENFYLFAILNKILYVIYIIWFTIILYYLMNISEDANESKKIPIMKYILLVSNIIFATLIFLFRVDIFYDANSGLSNSYGPASNVLFIAISIYILLMIILALKDIRKHKHKKYIPLYLLLIIMIIVLAIRQIDPLFSIYSNMLSFVTLVMYFTIENPDLKMVQELNYAIIQAEQSNQAKTDFLSSMSHEIRTPLNAIVGFNQCISDADTLEEAKENSKEVLAASNTLLEIVNGILDISKIEAGKMEINNSNYNAKELFNSVIKLVETKINDKKLELKVQIAEDIPNQLFGDQANIKKCILNLLTNAIKYTDKGFVSFNVNCILQDNICKLIIGVEDSGRGIKPENIDKLFTKFQRLNEDRNTTIEGTGLGLAITKQIIELMGGKVVVQSVFGSGSKFTIMLNQEITSDISKIEEQNKIIINDNKELKFNNKKALVVDDNVLNLKVATKLLQKYGLEVVESNSGFDCISKINSGEKYDLIFMDDMMPKMSGVETLAKLKTIDNFSIPTIALTANAIVGMKEKYINDGFSDYLAKPINKEELESYLIKYLKNSSKKDLIDFSNAVSFVLDFSKKE